MSDQQIEPGARIAERYYVVRVLSRGDMTAVVAANDTQTGRAVALKFMFDDALSNTEKRARLEREAATAKSIANDHVVEILDSVQSQSAPVIVMELLVGETLCNRLKREGPLPWEVSVDLLLQMCAGLARAHASRVFHRDLNPDNIFLTTRPHGGLHVKIINFGMSKADCADGASLTSTGALIGHPNYMSPEQVVNARDVDARTDIWALGTLLQEMITGKPAFNADSLPTLIHTIMEKPPAPLCAGRPEVPALLQSIVLRCLEKIRANRFRNVAELAGALAQSGAPGAEQAAKQVAGLLDSGEVSTQSPSAAGSRSTGLILAAVAALLCLAGLAAWLLLRAR
jgi:serine/threonine protein kinase